MDLKDLITESDKKKLKDLLQKLQVDYSPALKSLFTDKIKQMFTVMMNDAGKLDILNRPLRTWHFSAPHSESVEGSRYYQKRPNFLFFKAPTWVYLVCEIFGVDFMNVWRHWPEFLKPLQKYIMIKWVVVDWDKMEEMGKGTFDTWKPGD
ncbi:hypothetical protein ES703_58350 [subsurface metagenome]